MTTSTQVDPFAAERWFLKRGLPAVLGPGALTQRVLSRSAPALAACGLVAANSILVVAISGKHTIDIAGRPTLNQGVVLALLILVLPAAVVLGWGVSRIDSLSRRRVVATAALAAIALGVLFGGPANRIAVNLVIFGTALAAIIIATVTGLGSILGWAARNVVSNLKSAAGMFVRALPVVLLTFLVFFNSSVWTMAAVLPRGRLWVGLAFLFLIAAAFLVSSTLDQARPIMASSDPLPGDSGKLDGTPFAAIPDARDVPPLSTVEGVNVAFVLATSQVGQVFTVAALTGGIFLVLGMILVSPTLLDSWTGNRGRHDGNVFDMTLPIPDPLIQVCLFLTAITFMYLAAKAVTDQEYRVQFIDRVTDDLRVTLKARDRYLSHLALARPVA